MSTCLTLIPIDQEGYYCSMHREHEVGCGQGTAQWWSESGHQSSSRSLGVLRKQQFITDDEKINL